VFSQRIYLYIQLRTLSENIKFICTSCRNKYQSEPVSQRMQINFILSDNVRILCLSCNIKKSKTAAKLSENSRNKRLNDACFGYFQTIWKSFSLASHVTSAFILLPFLAVALHESGTRMLYLTTFITTQNHTIAG
jgi:hypothetical protein